MDSPLPLPGPTLKDQLETVVAALAILGAFGGAATIFVTRILPWLRARWDQRALRVRVGLGTYDERTIRDALRYYVPPDCQQTDPSGLEEPRALAAVDAPLFSTLRRNLDGGDHRFQILLADSGMGKTSAVINYCARHLRGWKRPKYGVAAFYLGVSEVDARIEAVEDKANTVLFLDALDEDTRAIEDHRARIARLVELAAPFRALVVTCRSQFFAHDEEIPRETGQLRVGPRRAGEGAVHTFKKLYLSPLSDAKVEQYLRQRYPVWQWKRRRRARAIVARVPSLSARPMLLAHVDDLLQHPEPFRHPAQIYEEMVRSWIERERGFVAEPEALLEFSKRLAVDLFVNREKRGTESVPLAELDALAASWGIRIKPPLLAQRSLLNRDADGNYKFAHRSIMEYLFVESFLEQPAFTTATRLTDQMGAFLLDRLTEDSPAPLSPQPDQTALGRAAHRGSREFLRSRIVPRGSFHGMLMRMALDRLAAEKVENGPAGPRSLAELVADLAWLWYLVPNCLPFLGLYAGTKALWSLFPPPPRLLDEEAFSIQLVLHTGPLRGLYTQFPRSGDLAAAMLNAGALADALGCKIIQLALQRPAVETISQASFAHTIPDSRAGFRVGQARFFYDDMSRRAFWASLNTLLPATWGVVSESAVSHVITPSTEPSEPLGSLQVVTAVGQALRQIGAAPSDVLFVFESGTGAKPQ